MIKSEIVAHSKNEQGDELISVLCTFPRIILAEVNTHRMLSKNTSSSRAIPFNKMVEAVQNNPFIPIAWQKEHSGMQGTEYITDESTIQVCINEWLIAKDQAISRAKYLNLITKTTKQLCNRLLEPFMWTTMLITGSKEGWENFFKLRCPQYTLNNDDIFRSKKDFKYFYKEATKVVENHLALPLFAEDADTVAWLKANKGQAEIHMMTLAESIYDSVNESTPKLLKGEEWHIPFLDKINSDKLENVLDKINYVPKNILNGVDFLTQAEINVSVALAARTSYTVVGEEKEIDYQKMIELHDRLLSQDPPHSSPLEHCAKCMNNHEHNTFVKGQVEWYSENNIANPDNNQKGWCNNFKGFIPYRYITDNSLSL